MAPVAAVAPAAQHEPMDVEGEAGEASSAAGGAGAEAEAGASTSERLAPGTSSTSRYYPAYLTPELEQDLLKWCRDGVRFQIYNCTSQSRVKGGEPRLKAPKAEFYLLDDNGRRSHYKWTQA